jgi:hypothetical protein
LDQSHDREQCSPIGSLQAKKPQARVEQGGAVQKAMETVLQQVAVACTGFEQNAVIIFTKRNNDSPSGMRQFLKKRGAIGTVGRVREISPVDRQSFYYTCQENPHRYLVS